MSTELTFSEQLNIALADAKDELPVGFNRSRFVSNAVALLNDNKPLQEFAQKYGTSQIKAGLLKAARLDVDAMAKECYLLPYGSQINLMLDYRGAKKVVIKHSTRKIKEIYAKIVREGDEFYEEIVQGEPTINFKPKPFNRSEIIGAFAVCQYEDGGIIYDTMNIDELNKSRSKSKNANTMAWKDFPEQMYVKTVLHRLCKHIPVSFDSPEQQNVFSEDVAIETDPAEIAKNNVAENGNSVDFVDAEFTEVK